jgi:lipopolysaccharide/colanic/teichoic acid biosynthesis glycosyltransferase
VELQQAQPNVADIVRPPTIAWRRFYIQGLKRILDIASALVILFLLWPVLLAIAVLVKLDSPGPALFVQKRIGKDGCPFRIYKFRTMVHRLDDSAHRKFMQAFVKGDLSPRGWSSRNLLSQGLASPADVLRPHTAIYKPFTEAQVTRTGRILRKTSLDELPQVINILKGEMSLVGPRPNVPYEVEAYSEWHRERLSVLPGITGLAQVQGRSTIDFDTIAKFDIQYTRRIGLGLDIRILLHTVFSVLRREGAR